MTDDDKKEYLYQAIVDTQGTIRAIDVKIGFMLVIVFAPLIAFDKVQPYLREVYKCGPLQVALCTLAIALWALSILAQFMALAAISNPADRIETLTAKGSFYGGTLYRMGLRDTFLNRAISAKQTLDQAVADLPTSTTELINELTFEKMKLAYIRSIKVTRANAAMRLLLACLLVTAASYLIFLSNHC